MLVVDASAVAELLLGRPAADGLGDLFAEHDFDLHAPHLLDVEVLSVLRSLLLGGKLEPGAAEDARRDHFALTITRHEVEPMADRIWDLRHQYTSYDACYLALAAALGAPLFTCDPKLIGTGHDAEVRVFPRTH